MRGTFESKRSLVVVFVAVTPCISFQENNVDLYRPALETLRLKIRESTSSMTSVPKPLKFLRPFYNDMIVIFEKINDAHNKVRRLPVDIDHVK